MKYSLKVRGEASIEIVDAYNWYEDKKDGLGEDFLKELEKTFKVLSKQPRIFQKKYKSFRSVRLGKFPFAVFYEIAGNTIVVYSVFHSSREPLSWRAK
ncbi:type II toxin-antitoxin system RelE/ParE family toxin [Owenweeksia hongkongensis]|uniref:type II toxin-antitoxin system RelE/ParE family toxin n=1 Tax=Owenweeksia hongkongensis TaxID=253245 RepID=UPI003A9341F0